MRIAGLLMVVGAVTVVSQATAEEVNQPIKEAVKSQEGYGNAGCGLGSLLFEPSNKITQIFAATTNGTSGTQTFGITSGTSNCDGAGYQPGSAAAYVQTNRAALAKDIARGKGATLAGLSEVAGCHDPRAVAKALRKNFKTIFPGPQVTDAQVSTSVVLLLKKDAVLACGNLASDPTI
jgi:hypothetical protein